MKIGYIVADYDVPLVGSEGCSLHIHGLTDALRAAGHDVFFLCAEPGERAGADDRVYAIEPRGLGAAAWDALMADMAVWNADLDRDLRLLFFNEWLQTEGARIVAAEQPDVLYERYALFGWGGTELARRRGIPLLLEVNTDLRTEQDGYRKFVFTEAAEQIERAVFGAASAVLPVSEWLRDYAVSQGAERERVHVVPNAVDASLFAEAPSGAATRARYGLADCHVVGFVGSLQPWHDLTGLLHAFELLHTFDSDIRLLIVGDGDARSSLADEARRRRLGHAVTFTGHLTHAAVPDAIAAMDVAVAPYKGGQELGFLPMKLFEYMAAGRPTVAAAVGAIPSYVEDGETGRLYAPGDDEALAAAIAECLAEPGRAAEMGRRARDRALAEHTWDMTAAKVVALAERLVASG